MLKTLATLLAVASSGVALAASSVDGMRSVKLKGPLGERLDRMIERHVGGTDVDYITAPFLEKTERKGWWQTEFWGKYMHAAAPFCVYTGSAELCASIDRGLDRILSSQEPDGYIGNYPDELRCGEGWDVWGMKYTMMGLLHYYDAFGGDRGATALEACRRLCDYVIAELGPNGRRGRPFVTTGNCAGQPSCSMLEPVVWLYRRTGEKKYLDFAAHIVAQMDDPEIGPGLVRLADVPVYLRQDPAGRRFRWTTLKRNRLKAYEMMSCYQGLVEYYEATGERRFLEAAVKAADSIMRDEVNLAGGAASQEHWYHGAVKQHLPYVYMQETCVTITWMRLLEKLLAVTGDPKYADRFERTFYNAYLGALKPDGSEFAGYTPLSGTRYHGQHHCYMHTDCCTANGPRGFLSFLRAFFTVGEREVAFNQYASATVSGRMGAAGAPVAFDMYSLYPKDGRVRIVSHTQGAGSFALKLRIPAWADGAKVTLNGEPRSGVAAGRYHVLEREWKYGDVVELELPLTVRAHVLAGHVAFTRGPVLLARDTRFGDGDLSEVIPLARGANDVMRPYFAEGDAVGGVSAVRAPSDDFWMAFSLALPLGGHHENPEGQLPQGVRFCDYASAGNAWTPGNSYRTWFEMERCPADDDGQ